jgi:hypothetical protein
MDRYTKFILVAGAIVFLVLPPLILYAPRNDFGKECAQTCHSQGLDYEVVSLGRNALPGGYPARCDCVPWEPGAWWQFWKNAPPPQPLGSGPQESPVP